uniref:Uncharacterized protein n=1 Tax=Anguilla anguilla TaxID=7936 RepID=A0A0E9RIC7_ANGAN
MELPLKCFVFRIVWLFGCYHKHRLEKLNGISPVDV